MSWLTQKLGLDPAIAAQKAAAAGNTTVTSPVVVAAEDIGKVLVMIDPNLDQQIITAVNGVLTKLGLTLAEAEIDKLLEEEFTKLGV